MNQRETRIRPGGECREFGCQVFLGYIPFSDQSVLEGSCKDFAIVMSLIRSFSSCLGRRLISSARPDHRPQRFLPFEDARTWARQWARDTGGRTWKDWKYMRAVRPTFIPSNPDQVYKTEFKGIFDWLDRDRCRSRKVDASVICAAKPLQDRAFRMQQHMQGMQSFLDTAAAFAPDFEFLTMPKGANVDYIFRPRTTDADLWAGIHVRTGRSKTRNRRRMLFSRLENIAASGHAAALMDIAFRRLFLFPGGTIRVSGISVSLPGLCASGIYDKHLVKVMTDVNPFLDSEYQRGQLHSFEAWRSQVAVSDRDAILQKNIVQFQRRLYDPLGFDLVYARRETVVFNAILDGDLNVLHRCAYKRTYTTTYDRFEVTSTKNVNGTQIPLDLKDEIDLLILGVRNDDQETIGCFVFPQSEMVARDFFSTSGRGGLTSFALYPPWAEAASSPPGQHWRVVAGTRDWQADFFIDLSRVEILDEQRKIFCKIVQRARADKAKPKAIS